MKTNEIRIAVCPKCKKQYHGYPALSRFDSGVYICPDCGTREALESIGVDKDEQEEILNTIHSCMGQ